MKAPIRSRTLRWRDEEGRHALQIKRLKGQPNVFLSLYTEKSQGYSFDYVRIPARLTAEVATLIREYGKEREAISDAGEG